MSTSNRKTIAGIEFEAVRVVRPIPHWRAKVVATGYIFSAGCFKNESRPKMWDSIGYTALKLGERFAEQMLEAK